MSDLKPGDPGYNPRNHDYRDKTPIGQKGYSGNPGGRKKMPEKYKIAFKELSELGISCLRDILDGTDKSAKARERLRAAEVAFDRAWGKPMQQVEASIEDNRRVIDTSKLSPAQVDALAAIAIDTMNMETTEEEDEDAEALDADS